jgi:hypothetical protein
MKRLLKYSGVLFFLAFGLSSCYKDVILPTTSQTAPPQFVSYSTELQPLWTSNCALSGCHVAGSQAPYLTPDVSYKQLMSGYVNTTYPEQSKLYIAINGIMQVHIPLASDRQKVYDWIRNGAPNN